MDCRRAGCQSINVVGCGYGDERRGLARLCLEVVIKWRCARCRISPLESDRLATPTTANYWLLLLAAVPTEQVQGSCQASQAMTELSNVPQLPTKQYHVIIRTSHSSATEVPHSLLSVPVWSKNGACLFERVCPCRRCHTQIRRIT